VTSVLPILTAVGVKPLEDACLEEKNTLFAPLPVLMDGFLIDNLVMDLLLECS